MFHCLQVRMPWHSPHWSLYSARQASEAFRVTILESSTRSCTSCLQFRGSGARNLDRSSNWLATLLSNKSLTARSGSVLCSARVSRPRRNADRRSPVFSSNFRRCFCTRRGDLRSAVSAGSETRAELGRRVPLAAALGRQCLIEVANSFDQE